MIRRRLADKGYFECVECGKWITPASYRAACPMCGGELKRVTIPGE